MKNADNHTIRAIELLAPAKNLECGIAAINHGADAVYIGAKAYGARQAAGNDINDIAQLACYAHRFGAKVYVTVNTIVYEQEIKEVKQLLEDIIKANVDAILVQDMAVVKLMHDICKDQRFNSTRMPQLHASTQTDNRCSNKVKWLKEIGFSRVVLARELTLDEIKRIHTDNPDVELEVFVHGALCVSYSGACYASQHFFNRSANRGECAQFCRLPFDLKDSTGETIIHNRHLLSLKDMKQIDRIGDIVESGVSSLKIEGRLKDSAYVKNIVAAYSNKLNEFISQHPDKYRRSSYGHTTLSFAPNIDKTFNRGFTNYFLDGRSDDISSIETPKAIGEYVGYIKEIRKNSFNVAGTAIFANGDGLCFFDEGRRLVGFRVNRVENNRLFPLKMPYNLKPGTALYRNNDIAFERIMSGNTAERKIDIKFTLSKDGSNIILTAKDETERTASVSVEDTFEKAQKPQGENICRQLGKLGNTPFKMASMVASDGIENLFIPSSYIAHLKRDVIKAIENQEIHTENKTAVDKSTPSHSRGKEPIEAASINVANVANHVAENFYKKHNVINAKEAYETSHAKNHYSAKESMPLMTCRYCIRYALGYCIKHNGKKPSWKEPLYLQTTDGKNVRLGFNCKKCQMEIFEH